MSILEVFILAPTLCGAKNPARAARASRLIVEDEFDDEEGVFAQNEQDIEDPRNRLEEATAWRHTCRDKEKAEHLIDKIELLIIKHRELEHDDTDQRRTARAEFLIAKIKPVEDNYPDVKALLPLDYILLGFWV